MIYSTEPRDKFYVKVYGFLFFARGVSMDKSFLIPQKSQQLTSLRQLRKEQSKKQLKQQVVWLEIRLQKRLQGPLQRIKKI